MAIKLVSKTNTDPVSGTYPYGKIRDEVSPGDGTPIDTQVYGDFHQFFARMAALSGITLNDLPENSTNGFQYYEALIALTNPAYTSVGVTFQTIGGVTWANLAGGLYNVAYKLSQNEVSLCGAARITSTSTPGGIPIIELPLAARPTSIASVLARVDRSGTTTVESIDINTSGLVTVNMSVGSFTNVTVWLDGVTFRKS